MFKHKFGIPFRITCCGDAAARQFYNPLQERESDDKRAALYGEVSPSVARNFFKSVSKANNIFLINN